MYIWQIEDSRWDTFEQEIASGLPIDILGKGIAILQCRQAKLHG